MAEKNMKRYSLVEDFFKNKLSAKLNKIETTDRMNCDNVTKAIEN